ncbi:MAG: hypothetical protein ACOY4I_04820 [Bacillota bacterium]
MTRIVSKRLRGLMAEHDITLLDLSKRLNIPEKSLSLKINGRRNWMYRELISITMQFGFSEIKEVFPELYNYILTAG